jgi:RNA polymerase subunit RPABC4/transcription elongation factor Spt4
LKRYVIVHNSRYGATSGERLKIWVKTRKGKATLTQQTVQIVEGEKFEIGDTSLPTMKYLIEEVTCPECDAFDMRIGFEEGDICPECRSAKLEFSFVDP